VLACIWPATRRTRQYGRPRILYDDDQGISLTFLIEPRIVMAAEFEFSHQFYHNSHKFFSENIVYTAVTALLLYCKENDIGPELEVDAIRDLFQNDFGFTSLTVPNPSQRAQQELNKDIPSFVARYSNQIDTLILLYYAGHGDLDTRGKGLWAAYVLFVSGPNGFSYQFC